MSGAIIGAVVVAGGTYAAANKAGKDAEKLQQKGFNTIQQRLSGLRGFDNVGINSLTEAQKKGTQPINSNTMISLAGLNKPQEQQLGQVTESKDFNEDIQDAKTLSRERIAGGGYTQKEKDFFRTSLAKSAGESMQQGLTAVEQRLGARGFNLGSGGVTNQAIASEVLEPISMGQMKANQEFIMQGFQNKQIEVDRLINIGKTEQANKISLENFNNSVKLSTFNMQNVLAGLDIQIAESINNIQKINKDIQVMRTTGEIQNIQNLYDAQATALAQKTELTTTLGTKVFETFLGAATDKYFSGNSSNNNQPNFLTPNTNIKPTAINSSTGIPLTSLGNGLNIPNNITISK